MTYDAILHRGWENLFGSYATDEVFADCFRYHFGESLEASITEGRFGNCLRSKLFVALIEVLGATGRHSLSEIQQGQIAMVLEGIHHCMLIIDDWQDRAPLRKGKPTLWCVVEPATATNFALSLLWGGLKSLHDNFHIERAGVAAGLFFSFAQKATRAQTRDLKADWGRSWEEYEEAARGKTGALYALAGEFACHFSGFPANSPLCAWLKQVLSQAGVAHQLRDDLTDASSAEVSQEVFSNLPEVIEQNLRQSAYSVGGGPEPGQSPFEVVAAHHSEVVTYHSQVVERVRGLLAEASTHLNQVSRSLEKWQVRVLPLIEQIMLARNPL